MYRSVPSRSLTWQGSACLVSFSGGWELTSPRTSLTVLTRPRPPPRLTLRLTDRLFPNNRSIFRSSRIFWPLIVVSEGCFARWVLKSLDRFSHSSPTAPRLVYLRVLGVGDWRKFLTCVLARALTGSQSLTSPPGAHNFPVLDTTIR